MGRPEARPYVGQRSGRSPPAKETQSGKVPRMMRKLKRLVAVVTAVTAGVLGALALASPASANTDSCGSPHWGIGESPDNCCPWVIGRRTDPMLADCN